MEALKLGWDFFQGEILGMKWLNRVIGSFLESCGLDTSSRMGASVQFFLYDTIKIMVLLGCLILLISYIQSFFPPERTKKIGSTPILVDKGQKGRGTASCNLPATRYIIEANPLNVLKPRAFRFAACIMELIPSQTAFVMRW